MNNISILDCTLRDGGYCNNWNFGFDNTKRIINALIDSNIEIIECGFLTNKTESNTDLTKFNDLEQISRIIPDNREGKLFVVMLNYGEYDIENLPVFDGSSVDGIRLAFHKKEYKEAVELCKKIKDKGYLVFVQAMVSLIYSDDEYLDLIDRVNALNPYAFYIVDSFGIMKSKDLVHLFQIVETNLNQRIQIGFHSHNNIQLSYSNAQKLVSLDSSHNLIIDTSIMGMGRGAGNLNTELFLDYLNEELNMNYNIRPLLHIIDEIIDSFYQNNYWGYSLPNYISASHNAHPDYARFLDGKKTLTYSAMDDIFNMMEDDKKVSFDKSYIENLYFLYQEKNQAQKSRLPNFIEAINGRNVLIIAPGKSSLIEKEKIYKFIKENDVIVISINYDYDATITDFIFVSNLRRFRELSSDKLSKSIVTSNISTLDAFLKIDYKSLLNEIKDVQDNAGLMLIKLLVNIGIKTIYLAGMDGYSSDPYNDYAKQSMYLYTDKKLSDSKNTGIMSMLNEYKKRTHIKFVTTPKYLKL